MWSKRQYDYERLSREQGPPRSHPSDGNHTVVNIVPKISPLLGPGAGSYSRSRSHVVYRDRDTTIPPLLGPGEGSYSRSRSHVTYRDRDTMMPPLLGPDEGSYNRSRSHAAYRDRDTRGGSRRKRFYSPSYVRDRSPHKRQSYFLTHSPPSQNDSPCSRSGSSVSRRSYSPERSKTDSFHRSQQRSKERPVQSLKTSRDTSPSSSSAISSSKVLDKPSNLTEKELAEALRRWATVKLVKADEIYECETGPKGPLFIYQPEEPESNATDGTELFEDSQLNSRSKAISLSKVLDKPSRLTEKELAEATRKQDAVKLVKADEILECEAGSKGPLSIHQPEEPESKATDGTEFFEESQQKSRSKAIAWKTREIRQVYQQRCAMFGMVVKMLVQKDPSLEKSIQFALRQNLRQIGGLCLEELKRFIAEYDTSNQDFGEPFEKIPCSVKKEKDCF